MFFNNKHFFEFLVIFDICSMKLLFCHSIDGTRCYNLRLKHLIIINDEHSKDLIENKKYQET